MKNNFINPYNFIALKNNDEGCASANEQSEEKYTGVIEYSLLTKTPLFVPNTSNDHAILPEEYEKVKDEQKKNGEYHKSYEFFAYEDLSEAETVKTDDELKAPVIPGSEMRGMVRSLYETLTDSCLSAIDKELDLSKRTSELYKPGLIERVNENGKIFYYLHDAQDCLLRTEGSDNLNIDLEWKDDSDHNSRRCYVQKDLKEGQEVWVKIINRDRGKRVVEKLEISDPARREYQIGYVIKGEDGPPMKDKPGNTKKEQKHCCHVFIEQKNLNEKVYLQNLDRLLEIYGSNKLYVEYKNELGKFRKTNGNKFFPVYYSVIVEDKKEGPIKRYFLSPASITREVYKSKLDDIIKGYKPCENRKDKTQICPACSLFGYLGRATKVRMGDMKYISFLGEDKPISSLYEAPVRLKELASPKIGNMEFYVRRPDSNALFWTYEYWVDNEGKIHIENGHINGRKFYWHQVGRKLDYADGEVSKDNEDSLKRKTTVRPLKTGCILSGKLFFDGISKDELDMLIYILNGTEEYSKGEKGSLNAKQYGYKLGHAKPLGLGSVALNVDSVKLRSVKIEDESVICEMSKEYEDYSKPHFLDASIEQAFKQMTEFDVLNIDKTKDIPVTYPRIVDGMEQTESKIFDWFVQNHGAYTFKKKKNCNEVSFPAPRNNMFFNYYMQSGKPCLEETSAKKILKIHENSGEKEKGFEQHKKNNSSSRRSNTCEGQTRRITGTIRFFDVEKGFGKIKGEDGIDYKIKVGRYNNDFIPEKASPGAKVKFAPQTDQYGNHVANNCIVE